MATVTSSQRKLTHTSGTYQSSGNITVGGSIVVSGSVDGRDVSADGAKLDTIETNAKDDQTAAEILTLLKTVDGSGSGLDADLLDGLHSSSFAQLSSSNSFTNSYNEFGNNTGAVSNDGSWNARLNLSGTNHARLDLFEDNDNSKLRLYVHVGQGARIDTTSATSLNLGTNGTVRMTIPSGSGVVTTTGQGTLWGSSNDGSGSGLDADKLDGLHASSFNQTIGTDTDLTASGASVISSINVTDGVITSMGTRSLTLANLGYSGATNADVTPSWVPSSNPNYATQSYVTTQINNLVDGAPAALNTLNELAAAIDDNSSYASSITTALSGKLGINAKAADSNLLDGIDSSAFLRSNANDDFSGTLNYTPDTGTILSVDGQAILQRMTANGAITIGHDDAVIIAGGDTSTVLNSNINNAGETVFVGAEGGFIAYAFPNNNTAWSNRKELKWNGTDLSVLGYNVWHSNNDGSGSGLDADKLDGLHASSFNQTIGTDTDLSASGASVISSINVTDGVITSMGTRSLTLANLGYTGETNATADQTAGEIKTLLQTVDGSGSNIDADLLDSKHLADIIPKPSQSDFADGTLVTTSIDASVTNGESFVIEVSGKSYSSSVPPHMAIAQGYIYNNTIINFSGVNITGNTFTTIKAMNNNGYLSFWWPRHAYWNAYNVHVRKMNGTSTGGDNEVTSIANSTEPSGATKKVTINLAKTWNSYSDGSGSGLDADKLDGLHASSFNQVIGTDADLNTSGSAIIDNINVTDGVITSMGTRSLTLANLGYTGETNATADQSASEILNLLKTVDGSGSGLDADTLDGAQPSASASNSTIVKRHSSGYIYANYFNTTANDVSSGVTKVMVETGNDGFIRHGSAAAIRSFINVESGATADQSASEILTLLKTVDGAGSGLDADTLDGITSARIPYALTGSNGTTNTYTVDGGIGANNITRSMFFRDNAQTFGALGMHITHATSTAYAFQFVNNSYSTPSALKARVKNNGTWSSSVDIWNSGNDGSGSGLDADKLDGQHGSHYLNYNNFSNTPTIPTNNNQLSNGAGYVTSSGNTVIGTDSDINTSGATVIDQLNMTDGVITSHSTRTLTLANLGYTGATNANNYVLPSSISLNSLTVDNNKIDTDGTFGTSYGSYGIGTTNLQNGHHRIFAKPSDHMYFAAASSKGFRFRPNGGSSSGGVQSAITSAGNFAIGATSASSKLAVNGGVAVGGSYTGVSAPSNGMVIQGNVGIGTSSVSGYYALQVNGSIQGSYKSFVIDHPTKEKKQLVHASLEGPEIGVYFRGKNTTDTITMPDYWDGLVDLDSMTVELTAIGGNQSLFVASMESNGDVVVGSNTDEPLNYYYVIYGERKDIDKLAIEVDIEENEVEVIETPEPEVGSVDYIDAELSNA